MGSSLSANRRAARGGARRFTLRGRPRNAPCPALQRADAIGERALGSSRPRRRGWRRAVGPAGGRRCRAGLEDRSDRRLRALERGGEPRDLDRNVVDALAQHGVLFAFVGDRVLNVALEAGELALQPVALLVRALELALDQAFLGGQCLGCRPIGLRFGRSRDELTLELADAVAELLDPAALFAEVLVQRGGLAGLPAETIAPGGDLTLVALDLVVQDFGLRAQGGEFDTLAFGAHRAVVELGGELGKLLLRARQRVRGPLLRARLVGKRRLEGAQVLGQVPFPRFERQHRRGLLAELEFEAAD